MNKNESRYFNTALKMNEALMSLLEKKDFEYITVSEICKLAKVNRSTFYLHYENIYDLLGETTRNLLDGFLEYFSIDTKTMSMNFYDKELFELNFITNEYLNPYLLYIKENSRVFSTAVARFGYMGFEDVYKRMFRHIFNPILDRFHYPENDRKFVMMFYLSGINAIVNEWLKEDCKTSIEEICKIINECIFGLDSALSDEIKLKKDIDKLKKWCYNTNNKNIQTQ